MNSPKVLKTLCLLLLLLTATARAAVPWRPTLAAALDEARHDHRLVFLEFTAPG